jgi:hypothetical protein
MLSTQHHQTNSNHTGTLLSCFLCFSCRGSSWHLPVFTKPPNKLVQQAESLCCRSSFRSCFQPFSSCFPQWFAAGKGKCTGITPSPPQQSCAGSFRAQPAPSSVCPAGNLLVQGICLAACLTVVQTCGHSSLLFKHPGALKTSPLLAEGA